MANASCTCETIVARGHGCLLCWQPTRKPLGDSIWNWRRNSQRSLFFSSQMSLAPRALLGLLQTDCGVELHAGRIRVGSSRLQVLPGPRQVLRHRALHRDAQHALVRAQRLRQRRDVALHVVHTNNEVTGVYPVWFVALPVPLLCGATVIDVLNHQAGTAGRADQYHVDAKPAVRRLLQLGFEGKHPIRGFRAIAWTNGCHVQRLIRLQ
mmetsp:Transcript_67558/g.187327  ORF Transcript_67558/g.187327 Transcript_67558/m.187327 type:complete len:209 (-) Transcript_67558:9-635(-)